MPNKNLKIRAETNKRWRARNPERCRELHRGTMAWQRFIVDFCRNVPCQDCGKKFAICCMDFDHVRGKKLFSIGEISGWVAARHRLYKEINKCEVVCSNCHRLRHYKENASRF
jgi:hypothetical protein